MHACVRVIQPGPSSMRLSRSILGEMVGGIRVSYTIATNVRYRPKADVRPYNSQIQPNQLSFAPNSAQGDYHVTL